MKQDLGAVTPTGNGLTAKQRDTLVFVVAFAATHGYAPSVRDLCNSFGITTNAVVDRLKGLEKKGAIRRDAGVARGIVVLVRP